MNDAEANAIKQGAIARTLPPGCGDDIEALEEIAYDAGWNAGYRAGMANALDGMEFHVTTAQKWVREQKWRQP